MGDVVTPTKATQLGCGGSRASVSASLMKSDRAASSAVGEGASAMPLLASPLPPPPPRAAAAAAMRCAPLPLSTLTATGTPTNVPEYTVPKLPLPTSQPISISSRAIFSTSSSLSNIDSRAGAAVRRRGGGGCFRFTPGGSDCGMLPYTAPTSLPLLPTWLPTPLLFELPALLASPPARTEGGTGVRGDLGDVDSSSAAFARPVCEYERGDGRPSASRPRPSASVGTGSGGNLPLLLRRSSSSTADGGASGVERGDCVLPPLPPPAPTPPPPPPVASSTSSSSSSLSEMITVGTSDDSASVARRDEWRRERLLLLRSCRSNAFSALRSVAAIDGRIDSSSKLARYAGGNGTCWYSSASLSDPTLSSERLDASMARPAAAPMPPVPPNLLGEPALPPLAPSTAATTLVVLVLRRLPPAPPPLLPLERLPLPLDGLDILVLGSDASRLSVPPLPIALLRSCTMLPPTFDAAGGVDEVLPCVRLPLRLRTSSSSSLRSVICGDEAVDCNRGRCVDVAGTDATNRVNAKNESKL
mmetsp:Transcript_19318/g.47398  ORF Transcript_19318/g.47398 Transcript_19318/m.47398 type:complete len:530 (-) Transcript_19318:414-2003(-)